MSEHAFLLGGLGRALTPQGFPLCGPAGILLCPIGRELHLRAHDAVTARVEALWAVLAPRVGLVFSARDGVSDSRHVSVLSLRLFVALLELFNEGRSRRLGVEQPELVLAHLRYCLAREDREMPTHVALRDLERAQRGSLSDCVRWRVHGSLFNLNPSGARTQKKTIASTSIE